MKPISHVNSKENQSDSQGRNDDFFLIPSSLPNKQDTITIILLWKGEYGGNVVISCKEALRPLYAYFTIEKLLEAHPQYQLGFSPDECFQKLIPLDVFEKDTSMRKMDCKSFTNYHSKKFLETNCFYTARLHYW